jgi:Holliday junction resolvase RusA-like endonuclease
LIEIRLSYIGPVVSINAKFMHMKSGRSFLAPKFRAFKDAMILTFRGQRTEICPIENKVIVRVVLHVGNRLDIDALEKTILDSLEKAGILKNDKRVKGYFLWNEEDIIPEYNTPSFEVRIEVIGQVIKQGEIWDAMRL